MIDPNTMALAIIAVFNAITAVVAYRTHTAVRAAAKDIKMVEVNTNSLTTRLVATTKTAAYAEGVKEEHDRPT